MSSVSPDALHPLPEPLTPTDCDLSTFAFMPLDVQRLLTSETWVLGSGDERAAAMTLWLASWHQVPAASVPDNDRMLAHLSQCARWDKVKAHVLRGWVKCSDGRLYHPVVAEKALESWVEKLLNAISGATGNARRWGVEVDISGLQGQLVEAVAALKSIAPQSRTLKKKGVITLATGSPPESGSDRNRQGQGQGQGQGYLKDQEQAPQQRRPSPEAGDDQPTEKPKRASRLPEDWALPDDWLDWALTERPEFSEADMRKVGEGFRDYWCSAAGKGATKVDWLATWRNWVRKESAPSATPRKPAVGSKRYPFIPPRGYQLEDHEFWHPQMTDTVLSTRTHDFSTLERLPDGEGAC
ncbi:TPA: DUF1376 domain-containing protein [Pseudomonas aeruginosa]|nr:DUF1376 domain-containing protein [Pseudomonas aeruginosa]